MTERQKIGLILAACALGLAIVGALAGRAEADVYHWVTVDGVYSWTDDEGQVPAAYRPGATVMESLPSLEDYPRFTPAGQKGQALQDRAEGHDLPVAGPAGRASADRGRSHP